MGRLGFNTGNTFGKTLSTFSGLHYSGRLEPVPEDLAMWLVNYTGEFTYLDKIDELSPPIDVGVPVASYNGVDQFTNTGVVLNYGSHDWELSAWFNKTTGAPTVGNIIDGRDINDDGARLITVSNKVWASNNTDDAISASFSYDEWHYTVAKRVGSTLYLTVDGAMTSVPITSGDINVSQSAIIGASKTGSEQLQGKIAHAKSSCAVGTSCFYYPCTEVPFYDVSGNGNDAISAPATDPTIVLADGVPNFFKRYGGTVDGTTEIPALIEKVNGERVDARDGLPVTHSGSIDGALINNGGASGIRMTDPFFKVKDSVVNIADIANDTITVTGLTGDEVITQDGLEFSERLETNGDFDDDSDWNKNQNWSISSGSANCDGTSDQDINQGITLPEIGSVYFFEINVQSVSQGSVYVRFGGVISGIYSSQGTYKGVLIPVNNGRLAIDSLNLFIGSVSSIRLYKVISGAVPYASANLVKFYNTGSVFGNLYADGALLCNLSNQKEEVATIKSLNPAFPTISANTGAQGLEGFWELEAWINLYFDGTNFTDVYYADEKAHKNGEDGIYFKSAPDKIGTAGICQTKEMGVYHPVKSFTPAEYTKNAKYWSVCPPPDWAEPLVPAEVTTGTGIGPNGEWADNGAGQVLLVEDA